MNILFVSDVYFPRINGVSTSIQTFRRELRAQGHHVTLMAPDYGAPSDDESDILRIPARYLPMDPEDRMMKFGDAMRHLGELRAGMFDVVHIHTPFVAHYLGLKLARVLRVPCVETYHTFFEEYLYHYIRFLPKGLMRLGARRFSCHQGNALDGMVVPSQPMLDVLRDYGVTTRMRVIPTGLDDSSFRPGDAAGFRQRYAIPQQRPLMLFVGRLAFEKNIPFLLEVLQLVRHSVPDVLLLIAGEGPAQPALAQAVQEAGIGAHVRFMGYLDRRTELSDCYAAGDVFVFSSRTETQGLVLLEAMAQATAVVAMVEMGTKDVLKEGEGVWIAAEDVAQFSAKVVTLLREPALREQLGSAGRRYAFTWSAATQAQRLVAYYRELITDYAGRA